MLAAWATTSRPKGFSAYVRESRVAIETEGTRRAARSRALRRDLSSPIVHLDVIGRSENGSPAAIAAP
jgi:hypothetical protein